MNLRVGSVSSGIGGDVVAWGPLGWEHVFCSEIAAFPSAVLAERCPDVPNLGDFTAADFCDRARACGSIDVFAGGTPCQAFSVAGKRASLDDARGNLTLRFVEIVHELNPAIVVWENVPGVLSTEDNAFGCFLGGMVGAETALIPCDDCGSHYAKRYWRTRVVQDDEGEPSECWRYPVWPDYGMVAGPKRSLAWRILDAQHFGLAQRRRRVIVVSFRTRDGINPGAVLFEPESLRRNTAPSREEGQRVAGTLAAGAHPSGFNGQDADKGNVVAHPLLAKGNSSHGEDLETYVAHALTGHHGRNAGEDNYVAHSLRGEGFDASEDGTGRGTPIVPVGFNSRQDPDVSGEIAGALDSGHPQAQAVAVTVSSANSCEKKSHARQTDRARALDSCGGFAPGQGGTVVASAVPFDTTQITSAANYSNPKPGDPCHPLASEAHAPAVAFVERGRDGGRSCESQEDIAYTLLNPGEGGRTSEGCVVDPVMRVRRLMPAECERLQGFPPVESVIDFGIHSGTIRSCTEHPRNYVNAAARSLRLQNSASRVEDAKLSPYVKSVMRHFCTCHQTNDVPVVVTVRANFADGTLQLHNEAGELIWSANIASESGESRSRMRADVFAQLVAAIFICAERIQRTGAEGLHRHTEPSTLAGRGSWHVEMSGPNIGDVVSDADKSTWRDCDYMKSIISNAMQNTQTPDSTVTILCSYALTAITGFIPAKTLSRHSCILRLIQTDAWTRIPWRKKGPELCPDGPRYKGLGNAWATNVFNWLGHRIELVLMALKKRPRWLGKRK